MHIVDEHHRHAVFGELWLHDELRFDWMRAKIKVLVTMRADGTRLLSVEVMKNSNMLDYASSKALPCVDVLCVRRVVIEYSRTFDEC